MFIELSLYQIFAVVTWAELTRNGIPNCTIISNCGSFSNVALIYIFNADLGLAAPTDYIS